MNENRIAFVFPGQGSQSLGMGMELAETFIIARQTFDQADEQLGFSLSRIAWEGPEILLNDTINTQPALLVHSVAVWRVLLELHPDLHPVFVAGHSMGELSALVACHALSFPDALALTRRRGELMKQAGEKNPGGMAAILGLDVPTLDDICARASKPDEVVQVANDNCPGQVIISGASKALERAIILAQESGARRARSLAVSIAAHSPLMTHAQKDYMLAVDAAPIIDPQIPLVGNVTASPLLYASQIRTDLQAQLTSRVRWTESIQWMASHGVETYFELGNGSVLSGLIKRIDERVNVLSIGSPADLSKVIDESSSID